MTNGSNKEAYDNKDGSNGRAVKVLGLGFVSAASAIAGGIAVAWWYRKTLTKLQNPIVSVRFQKSGFPATEEVDQDPADAEELRRIAGD